MKKLLHRIYSVCAILTVTVAIAQAGNVPQYTYETSNSPYKGFNDGTPVTSTWEKCTLLFADGTETADEYTGQGFPIGFDFKLGGKTFNQFAISNYGVLYLGKDAVSFNGRPSFYFAGIQQGKDSDKPNSAYYNTFYTGMPPINCGIFGGTISYKTTGETGDRICTVQFKDMVLKENNPQGNGSYSLQIRLYEKDNAVETAFKEAETCYSASTGFYAGIRGWDDDDSILLTGTGLTKDIRVSPERIGNMISFNSFIKWDSQDYDQAYTITHRFTPENNPVAPANAPQALTIRESDGALYFACEKAEGAKATLLLYSTSPITDNDLPADGETYGVGSTLGNCTVLYYGDGERISASLSDKIVKASTTYYACALSANGTPVFNRTDKAEMQYTTTQKAPDRLTVTATGTDAMQVSCTASYPVLIAVTDRHSDAGGSGYTGKFGQPDADMTVGSEIPDGGKVIYVGDASEFTYETPLANRMHYFKAWTMDGDLLSSTSADAYSVPLPSFPYTPDVENYPQGSTPDGWIYDGREFTPVIREYDQAPALVGTSESAAQVSLYTPELPLDRTSRLTFEYSLETMAEAGGKDSKGYQPGIFGEGGHALIVTTNDNATPTPANGTERHRITTYDGTMVPTAEGDGTFCTGSSEFKTVTVDLPVLTRKSRIGFSVSALTFSKLYLRNISIEATGPSAIETSESIPDGITVQGGEGLIRILSATDKVIDLYGIDGRKVATLSAKAGVETSIPMNAGIYLMEGRKVMVFGN